MSVTNFLKIVKWIIWHDGIIFLIKFIKKKDKRKFVKIIIIIYFEIIKLILKIKKNYMFLKLYFKTSTSV